MTDDLATCRSASAGLRRFPERHDRPHDSNALCASVDVKLIPVDNLWTKFQLTSLRKVDRKTYHIRGTLLPKSKPWQPKANLNPTHQGGDQN